MNIQKLMSGLNYKFVFSKKQKTVLGAQKAAKEGKVYKPRKKERVSTSSKKKCRYCSKRDIIINHTTEQCRSKQKEVTGQ